MSATRRTMMAVVALALALSPMLPSAQAGAATPRTNTAAPHTTTATPRTTLLAIEHQVMCVTCKIPLNVAESPQSTRERVYIRGLIAEGQTEAQIKNSLVAQYGPSVLDLPGTKGFDLAAYLVPAAVVLALLALLVLLLPSWRRHARTRASTGVDVPKLSADDAARLDADLAHFD